MTDIYDYYLYNFSKIYLREGKLAPKGVAIHKGPQDGRFYYSDGRSRDHTHNAQYISNRDIEVLEMVRSGTLNLENIGAYAILMLEKLGLVTEDEDGETILTDEGEQIKSPGIAVLSRVDREEALLKNPLKSRKMVVDDQLLKELDGIKNYDPDNPFDRVRPSGKRVELFEGLGLIHSMKGSLGGLTDIGERILNTNIGEVVSIPLPPDVRIRVPNDNHNDTNNLNPLEESMVEWYKHRGYESINRAILSGDVSDVSVNNAICCLDNVLERHKIVNPQTVYSGVGSRVGNMLLSMNKGDTFQIDTYLSTSLRKSTALTFSNSIPVDGNYRKVVLKVNTPMNATGYYYGDTEEYDDEDEILFPRATQYILKSKEEKGEAIIITCDRIDKSTKATQVDNSRVYLNPGEKAPQGATIYAGTRKRTARYYKTEEVRSKETYGRNVGHIYVAPEDLEALNKIQFFDPSLEEIKQKYFKDFPDTPDEIVMDFKDDYLERGPDLTDDEFDRLNRMTNVGLTYWDGRKYCVTADGVEIRKPGVNLIKRYRREELIAQNAKTYGFISDKPEYPVDITREDHSQMPMSEGERSALTGYKGSLYKEINPALLGSGNLKMNLHRIANLDALLSRSVISSPTVTYNGTSSRIGEMLMSMAPGDMFQIDTYLSTSLSSGTAAGFSSDFYGSLGKKTSQVLLEITLPEGTHGFYFGENDTVDHPEGDQFGGPEREILLPRASQFRIDAIEKEAGSDTYRDRYTVKVTLMAPPKKEVAQQEMALKSSTYTVFVTPEIRGALERIRDNKKVDQYGEYKLLYSTGLISRGDRTIDITDDGKKLLESGRDVVILDRVEREHCIQNSEVVKRVLTDEIVDLLNKMANKEEVSPEDKKRLFNLGLTRSSIYGPLNKLGNAVRNLKPGDRIPNYSERQSVGLEHHSWSNFGELDDGLLSPVEENVMDAYKAYQGNHYVAISNEVLSNLRRYRNGDNEIFNEICVLDNLIDRCSLNMPVTLYNGCSHNTSRLLLNTDVKPGDIFQLDTFTSTSLKSDKAGEFTSWEKEYSTGKDFKVVMIIHQGAGQPCLYYGDYDKEAEVLLPRGTQLKVKDIRDKYPYRIVECDRLGGEADPTIQADNSRVYLKEGEKPPKGVRLHKGIRKATARWYESQEYKKNMGENKLSRLLLKAMKKLKGKYAQSGTHERKSVQDVLKKVYGTYSIMQFVEDLNREHYPEFSNYNLTSYGEGDALKRLLPGMMGQIQSDEPLHAPLQYRDSSYDEVRALTKIKSGETFISKKWLPLYGDKKGALNATMNLYSDEEVKKIIFRVDASAGMEGVSYEDLLIGKENQPFEVTGVQDEEGIRTIDVKPLSNDQYGEKGVLPLGLPRSYYDKKAQELQGRNGLNNIIKSLEGKPSLVFEDSEVELESIFGEYKGDYHFVSDKLQKIQQHQSHQAHNGNWFGDTALEGMSLLKMACDASPPLNDLTIYIPFDAVQAYKRPQSEDENSQVRERVEIVENLDVGDTFKIRMNMVGSLSPDVANSKSTYQYTDNRVSKYGMITYRYKPHGNPEFDKGVVTSEGSVILQRNLNWKVVGIHDVRISSWLIPVSSDMGYSHKLFTLSSPIVNWTFKAESAGLSHY